MTFGGIIHLCFLFLIILDPLGNVPIFVGALSHLEPKRQRSIIFREMLIALGIMIAFVFVGEGFFDLLHITTYSLEITGGVILFLIALPMIFSKPMDEVKMTKKDPLIVPLAVPAVAGPAILAAITIYAGGVESSRLVVLIAIAVSWLLSLPVLLLAPALKKLLGNNGLVAAEHLFGFLVILVSAQMILHGLLGAFDFHCPTTTS